jgi:DnaJ-class molecular chaperone
MSIGFTPSRPAPHDAGARAKIDRRQEFYRISTRQRHGRKMLDPYTTLQVGRQATQDEIKRAYRKLAKQFHPDLHPNNPASARRFKDITEAYDILSDAAKRRRYDLGLAQAEQAAEGSFDDGLDAFFSGRRWGFGANAGGPRQRGADIFQSLTIGFAEAALGTRRRVIVNDSRSLDVTIPPLTEDGQTLRLKGQGQSGRSGGTSGDLLIEITVEGHPLFTRRNLDIHMVLPVTIPEAVLGGAATVPTVHGPVQLRIPKGSNTDTRLRLKGKGLAGPDGAQGDHYVTLKVVLPDPNDPEFRRQVETWSKRYGYRVRPPEFGE